MSGSLSRALVVRALLAGVVAGMLTVLTAAPATASERNIAAALDDWIERRMVTDDIPGLAIAVMVDGEVIYRAGHGVEDLGTERPVSPQHSRFHLGSVSKAMTATEIMRQVQVGSLDLDTPVDRYLAPDVLSGRAPTLRQLLSHAGGYEQQVIGTGTAVPDRWVPLAGYLARRPPHQVVEPGAMTIYSSPGVALAGLVLETVTEQPFNDAMASGLLAAAGMEHTSFPTPPHDPATAIGHRPTEGGVEAYDEPYFSLLAPGGDVVSTADDMARFLQVQLDDGVLGTTTRREMQRVWIRNRPALRGRALGFSEWRHDGRTGLFQDGGAPGTLSRVFLMPEHHIGMFVVHTNGEAYSFNRELTVELVELLQVPPSEETRPPAHSEAVDLDAVTGSYRDYTTSAEGLGRLAQLLNQTQVSRAADGLRIGGRDYRHRTDGLLAASDGDLATFGESPSGVQHLLIGPAAYRKVSWWQQARIQFGILAVAVATALGGAAIGAVCGLRRSIPRGPAVALAASGLAVLVYIGAASVTLSALLADPWQAVTGGEPWQLRPLALLLVAGFASSAAAWWTLRRRRLRTPRRLLFAQFIAVGTIASWSFAWGLA